MTILVVDDSLFVRHFLKKKIHENVPAAKVLLGESGEDGYKIFQEENPNVIITDLLMPGMNGLDFIKMIRSADKDVKIFVLTADIQKVVQEEVLNAGATDFIKKPLDDDKFQTVLNYIREGT